MVNKGRGPEKSKSKESQSRIRCITYVRNRRRIIKKVDTREEYAWRPMMLNLIWNDYSLQISTSCILMLSIASKPQAHGLIVFWIVIIFLSADIQKFLKNFLKTCMKNFVRFIITSARYKKTTILNSTVSLTWMRHPSSSIWLVLLQLIAMGHNWYLYAQQEMTRIDLLMFWEYLQMEPSSHQWWFLKERENLRANIHRASHQNVKMDGWDENLMKDWLETIWQVSKNEYCPRCHSWWAYIHFTTIGCNTSLLKRETWRNQQTI